MELKPLFKKKQVKSRASRKTRLDTDDAMDQVESGVRPVKPMRPSLTQENLKEHTKEHLKPIGNPKKSPEIELPTNEADEITLGRYNEGDIITGEEMDFDLSQPVEPEPKKYVPHFDDEIEKRLSKRQTLDELVHEYDDKDEYDDEKHDNYASIDPEPESHDLDLNMDDELVNDEVYDLKPSGVPKVDDTKYDIQLGFSDDEETKSPTATRDEGKALKVVQLVSASEEVNVVAEMMESLKLQIGRYNNDLSETTNQLEVLHTKKSELVRTLQTN